MDDDASDDDVTTLGGPVELIDGQLTMRIPLSVGGDAFVDCARGIGQVDGNDLVVIIPEWLGTKLGILDGTQVVFDNRNGKFNIYVEHGTVQ
jgi:hypothetical protein